MNPGRGQDLAFAPRLQGQLDVLSGRELRIEAAPVGARTQDVGHHVAGQIAAPAAAASPVPLEPELEEVRGELGHLMKGLSGTPHLHTSGGHPIYFDAEAHDPEHHAMSAGGHREAGEALRQAVKLLLYLRDLKREGGDAKGALLFDREAQRFLARMDGHHQAARSKEAMAGHADRAAQHEQRAAALAREITGSKDQIGIGDYERATAHPKFADYARERHAALRASEGVRHAALAALGRAGGSASALELNRFLERHGHGFHGLAEGGDGAATSLQHDPEKARLDKTLTGSASLQPIPKVNPRLAELSARGGKARNAGGRQQREGAAKAPAQIAGVQVRQLGKGGGAESESVWKSLAGLHLASAALASQAHDSERAVHQGIRAMELVLAEVQPRTAAPSIPIPHDAATDATLVQKAIERRPLRPALDQRGFRPAPRYAPGQTAMGRVLRRYPDGTLDFEGAKHAVIDALRKMQDGAEQTPVEAALASLILPPGTAPTPESLAEVRLARLSAVERARLAALVLAHYRDVARADLSRLLARSVTEWRIGDVRKHLPDLLRADGFGLGGARLSKAGGGPGSRGGQVAYTTRSGKPVYASQARRLAPHMDAAMTRWHHQATRSGDPEHHAIAAKQALAAAFYHHHAGDAVAAEQAMSYADHHRARVKAHGHQSRTARWVEHHHPRTLSLLGLGG